MTDALMAESGGDAAHFPRRSRVPQASIPSTIVRRLQHSNRQSRGNPSQDPEFYEQGP